MGKKALSVLKLMVLAGILIGIPAYLLLFHLDEIRSLETIDEALLILKQYGSGLEGAAVYVAIQVLQIIVSVIPGQPFQIAAGYLFGFLPSLLLSLIGASIGATVSYFLARVLGRDALHTFFKKEQLERYVRIMNSKRAYVLVFLIYLIPGLPKDIMSYAAGTSEMKFRAFFPISLVGRTPAMSASILVGALYESQNFKALWVVIAVVAAVLVFCLIRRKAIKAYLDRLYDTVSK